MTFFIDFFSCWTVSDSLVQNNRIAKLNRNKQVFHSKIHMGGTTDA
jgi:hypothetical protein